MFFLSILIGKVPDFKERLYKLRIGLVNAQWQLYSKIGGDTEENYLPNALATSE